MWYDMMFMYCNDDMGDDFDDVDDDHDDDNWEI